jgi:hypothetical protein
LTWGLHSRPPTNDILRVGSLTTLCKHWAASRGKVGLSIVAKTRGCQHECTAEVWEWQRVSLLFFLCMATAKNQEKNFLTATTERAEKLLEKKFNLHP